MTHNFKYDAFIAYANTDAQYAKRLYALLSAIGQRVFLDSEALIGGDSWPEEIRKAQHDSLLTLILISDRIDSAYFQQEEILNAIDLARRDRRRVVPVYLTGTRVRGVIQAPLRQLQGVYWEEGSSLLSVAQKIEAALKASKRQQEWLHEIVPDTIIIVTGCHNIPEIFDRPSAYELKTAIDNMIESARRTFLRSIVMGDIWFERDSNIQNHRNLISIGSSEVNALTGVIARSGKRVHADEDGRWQIMRDGNRWALFGDRAEDTYDALSWFKDRDLPGFLGEIWSPL